MLEFFPIPLNIGLISLAVLLILLRRQGRSFSYRLRFSVFWVYLLAVVGVTLFPMPILNGTGVTLSWKTTADILSRVNLVPFDYSQFKYLNPAYVFLREIVANILLTLLFGFGINFVIRIRARTILWLSLAVGLGIETAQLAMCLLLGSAYRGVDINDSLMNALGVLCGYGLFRIFSRLHKIPISFS